MIADVVRTDAVARARAHRPRLVFAHHVHLHVHGDGLAGRFNAWLAMLVTRSVGTMWAAYLFAFIGLVSLPAAFLALLNGDTVTGVAWLSQSFIQLVLLPVILVGQNTISVAQDLRAEADHETLSALHTINLEQLRILESLHRAT